MTDKVKMSVTNKVLLSKNAFVVKEEVDKTCISKTPTIEARDDHRKQYEIPTVNNIKIETLPEICSSRTCNDNVENEDEAFSANDIKIEHNNGLLFCSHCQEYYQHYCTKCEMLVHILNPNTVRNTYNGESREILKGILEIKELLGCLGVFAVKVIPGGVKFGPFTGLSTSGCCWKLKDGRLLMYNDKSNFLNWMQYINRARSMFEQNLIAFQCDNNIYYRTIREIQADEELLVYFGEEYNDSLNKENEVNFIPTIEEDKNDVFACAFCCLGFRSKTYLKQHKTVCLSKSKGKFTIAELAQCSFCKIYLDKKEYMEYHIPYCHEKNDRKCIPLKQGSQTTEGKRDRSQPRHIYNCVHCKYKTIYKGDFKNHVNTHFEVKKYKCGMCNRRFRMKEYLKIHMEKIHTEEKPAQKLLINQEHPKVINAAHGSQDELKGLEYLKHDKCEIFKYKINKKLHLENHMKVKQLKDYKCETCIFTTNTKLNLDYHIKTKHFKEFNYKCTMCKYTANVKINLDYHIKTKHLNEFDYKCDICDYKTNRNTNLDYHFKTKHLQQFKYKCEACEYRTNGKQNLDYHVKTKHLQEFKYKCEICQYQTNLQPNLDYHIKTKHLKEFSHKCMKCKYKTNRKSNLDYHTKTKHLKEFDYQCEMCEYKTNLMPNLKSHTDAKHLHKFHSCVECDYKTKNKSKLKAHIIEHKNVNV